MILFSGTDVLHKWIIVKGKRVYKVITKLGGLYVYYDWLDQNRILESGRDIVIFESREDAEKFINGVLVHEGKKFADAKPMLLAVNLS